MIDSIGRRFAAPLLLSFALLFLCSPFADAHKPSDSYLALSVQNETVAGQWDIALRDLDFAIGLDADGNGEITWVVPPARRRSCRT